MKTTTVFENKMREANYASLSDARKGIASHPLTAEYIVDLLASRGILRVTADGAVVGCGASGVAAAGAKESGPKPWDPRWPKKDRILSLLDYEWEEPQEWMKMRALQGWLKEEGEVSSHWFTLHALWNLMKEGLVEKSDSGYCMTVAEHNKRRAKWQANYDTMTAGLKKVGPPYDREKMMDYLRNTPGHYYLEEPDFETWWTQEMFTTGADWRKKKGEL